MWYILLLGVHFNKITKAPQNFYWNSHRLFYNSKKHNNMKRWYNEGEALQSNHLFYQTSPIYFTFTTIILHTRTSLQTTSYYLRW